MSDIHELEIDMLVKLAALGEEKAQQDILQRFASLRRQLTEALRANSSDVSVPRDLVGPLCRFLEAADAISCSMADPKQNELSEAREAFEDVLQTTQSYTDDSLTEIEHFCYALKAMLSASPQAKGEGGITAELKHLANSALQSGKPSPDTGKGR